MTMNQFDPKHYKFPRTRREAGMSDGDIEGDAREGCGFTIMTLLLTIALAVLLLKFY